LNPPIIATALGLVLVTVVSAEIYSELNKPTFTPPTHVAPTPVAAAPVRVPVPIPLPIPLPVAAPTPEQDEPEVVHRPTKPKPVRTHHLSWDTKAQIVDKQLQALKQRQKYVKAMARKQHPSFWDKLFSVR
jgi:hypothetical protein